VAAAAADAARPRSKQVLRTRKRSAVYQHMPVLAERRAESLRLCLSEPAPDS
jgi:hypothetical protein